VIAVDSSADLADDQVYVQPQLQALSAKAAASAVDLHVILLSAKSNSANGVCMSAPLGSGSCPTDDNPPRFLHPAVTIGSTNALSLIISSYSQWSSVLRPPAQKHFVVITTDNSSMTATQFDSSLRQLDPMFTTYRFHGIYAFSAPSNVTCSTTPEPCCNTGIAVGTQYAALADGTGGVKVNICGHDFSAVWDRVTTCP